jgi:outer membrane protein OmpA-like peptidoglycan-associated protein
MMRMADRPSPRTSSTRAGAAALVLAAAVLDPTAGSAAAMPISQWPGPLPGVTLTERQPGPAADGSGLETPRPAEVAQAKTSPAGAPEVEGPGAAPPAAFLELNEALAAAAAKLEELSKAAEIAAEMGILRERAQALEQERARLVAAVEQAEAARDTAEQTAERARDELRLNQAAIAERRAREAELVRTAEQSAAELAQAREQLATIGQQLADANEAKEQASLRAMELQALLEQTQAEAREVRTALLEARDEVASVRSAQAEVEEERDGARAEAERLQASVVDLEEKLADARAETGRQRADKARVDQQLALLEEAASSATRIARQNLIAVEEKVELLHGALGRPSPAASSDAATSGRGGATAATGEVSDATVAPGAGDGVLPPPLKPGAAEPTAAAGADLAGIKAGGAAGAAAGSARLAAPAGDLPFEMRLQARSLLADLDAKSDARGVLMTVPGERLFAVNSDDIGVGAHDTLAKIAEIIGIYEGSEILITGHTDGIGEPVYNRMLSERRADLIRTFFVDNFGIEAARLKTQGQGEDRPIASNATNAGRQANRRVEVLIVN